MYALTKYDQERLCLIFGAAYDVPVVALRLFNVYGTRQALSNPYTGVLAIFASRLLNDRPPLDLRGRAAAARLRLGARHRARVRARAARRRCRRARGERRQRRERDRASRSRARLARGARQGRSSRRSRASIASATSATALPTSRSRGRRSATSRSSGSRTGCARSSRGCRRQTADDRVDGAADELRSRGLIR